MTRTTDDELDVAPIVAIEIQRRENRGGQQVYRHLLATEWRVIPNE